jgi:hypothetical protein
VDGWVEVKAILWIANSPQQDWFRSVSKIDKKIKLQKSN